MLHYISNQPTNLPLFPYFLVLPSLLPWTLFVIISSVKLWNTFPNDNIIQTNSISYFKYAIIVLGFLLLFGVSYYFVFLNISLGYWNCILLEFSNDTVGF